MAFVYGTPLSGVDTVASYASQLREQKIAEANQRRQDRIAFGKAIERKQQERVTPITAGEHGKRLGASSAQKAGKARMNSMTSTERTEFASKAAKTRWKTGRER